MEANEPFIPYGIVALTMNPQVLFNAIGDQVDFSNHLSKLKAFTEASDDTIADWLNVNVKTYRTYRVPGAVLRPDIQEHIVILLTLARHGLAVFGTSAAFGQWLHTAHFMLDQRRPADLLNTNSGVRLVDDRLSGIEFGDNA
jgi:putative toxin-antitoxin system antitoxin component (TIGR02293 family)